MEGLEILIELRSAKQVGLARLRAQRTCARDVWFRRVQGGLQRLAGARPWPAECRGPPMLPGLLERGLAPPHTHTLRGTVCLSTSLTLGRSGTALTTEAQGSDALAALGAGLAASTSCFLEVSRRLKSAKTLRSPCSKKPIRETLEDKMSHGGR